MHKSGPLDGEPLPLYCMAAANSPLALDTALLAALELDRRQSPLWRVAAIRKPDECDFGSFGYPVLLPEDFYGSGFLAPSVLNPIRFNPIRFMRGLVQRVMLKVGS